MQRYPKTRNGIGTSAREAIRLRVPNIVALLTFMGTNQGLFGWGQADDCV